MHQKKSDSDEGGLLKEVQMLEQVQKDEEGGASSTTIRLPTPPRRNASVATTAFVAAASATSTSPFVLITQRSESDSSEADYEPEDSKQRESRTARNRFLWESTLPEPTQHLSGHVIPGYNYDHIPIGASSKRTPEDFRIKPRRKPRFPSPFG